jgi:hypothetical protein
MRIGRERTVSLAKPAVVVMFALTTFGCGAPLRSSGATVTSGTEPAAVTQTLAIEPPSVTVDELTPISYAPIAQDRQYPAQDDMAAVVARLASSFPDIATASVGDSPIAGAPGPWLVVAETVPHDTAHPLRQIWEVEALQGAAAEELTSSPDLKGVFGGATVSYITDDGRDLPSYSGGAGLVYANQRFSGPNGTDEISTVVDETLTKYGLGNAKHQVDVYQADGPAVAVTLTVDDASQLNGQLGALSYDLSGGNQRWPAVFLEVKLASGPSIAQLSSSFRTGDGGMWTDPQFDKELGSPSHG